jgi:hypothetical protein
MPDFNDFLSRIQTDHAFYLQFRRNPQEALASYALSAEEGAALTKSGLQLLAFTGSGETTHTSTTSALLSADLEFDTASVVRRLEVQQAMAQTREASTHTDRLAAVLDLMEQIG